MKHISDRTIIHYFWKMIVWQQTLKFVRVGESNVFKL